MSTMWYAEDAAFDNGGEAVVLPRAIPLWEKLEKILQKSGTARNWGDRVVALGFSSGRIDIPATIDSR